MDPVYSGTCTLSDGTDLSSLYDTPHECDNSGGCWDLVVTGDEMTELSSEELCYADASCSSCSNPVLSSNQDVCLCESGGTWNGSSCDGSDPLSNTWGENSLDQAGCEAYSCVNLDGSTTGASSQEECETVGVCMNATADNSAECESLGGYWIATGPFWVPGGEWTPSAYYWLAGSSMIWTDTCE